MYFAYHNHVGYITINTGFSGQYTVVTNIPNLYYNCWHTLWRQIGQCGWTNFSITHFDIHYIHLHAIYIYMFTLYQPCTRCYIKEHMFSGIYSCDSFCEYNEYHFLTHVHNADRRSLTEGMVRLICVTEELCPWMCNWNGRFLHWLILRFFGCK